MIKLLTNKHPTHTTFRPSLFPNKMKVCNDYLNINITNSNVEKKTMLDVSI